MWVERWGGGIETWGLLGPCLGLRGRSFDAVLFFIPELLFVVCLFPWQTYFVECIANALTFDPLAASYRGASFGGRIAVIGSEACGHPTEL